MATLGILECDVLYDDLLADYQSYGQMFRRFFEQLGAKLEYRFYQVQQGEFPSDLNECDAYLLTGSKTGVYDIEPWIAPLQDFILKANNAQKKLLGVCFGHQILAHTLGGHASKSDKGWGIGVHATEIEHRPLWLNDDSQHIRLIYSHQDQVMRLPDNARRLASSEFCTNAAFYIGTEVLSFQGHPEFDATYLQRLLPRRKERIGEPTYQQGMATLAQPVDSERVGRWMLEFIALRLSSNPQVDSNS